MLLKPAMPLGRFHPMDWFLPGPCEPAGTDTREGQSVLPRAAAVASAGPMGVGQLAVARKTGQPISVPQVGCQRPAGRGLIPR